MIANPAITLHDKFEHQTLIIHKLKCIQSLVNRRILNKMKFIEKINENLKFWDNEWKAFSVQTSCSFSWPFSWSIERSICLQFNVYLSLQNVRLQPTKAMTTQPDFH